MIFSAINMRFKINHSTIAQFRDVLSLADPGVGPRGPGPPDPRF